MFDTASALFIGYCPRVGLVIGTRMLRDQIQLLLKL